MDSSIKEIAKSMMLQTLSDYSIADFAPVTSVSQGNTSNEVTSDTEGYSCGIHKISKGFNDIISKQFEPVGVKLLSIGITSWTINDPVLAHQLAQGAANNSVAQSKIVAAQQAAQVTRIAAEAEATAKKCIADAEGAAFKSKAEVIAAVTNEYLQNNPTAQKIVEYTLYTDMVSKASNPNLFFSMNHQSSLPQFTVPVMQPQVNP